MTLLISEELLVIGAKIVLRTDGHFVNFNWIIMTNSKAGIRAVNSHLFRFVLFYFVFHLFSFYGFTNWFFTNSLHKNCNSSKFYDDWSKFSRLGISEWTDLIWLSQKHWYYGFYLSRLVCLAPISQILPSIHVLPTK